MIAEKIIRYSPVKGIRNVGKPDDLAPDELAVAENVVIKTQARAIRREGYALAVPGNISSVWADGPDCLCVKDGSLCVIGPDLSVTPVLFGVGNAPMVYARAGTAVYFTNNAVIGKYASGQASLLQDPGRYPLRAMPPGYILEYHKGRLYVASYADGITTVRFSLYTGYDNTVWRHNYKQFPGRLTIMAAVDDGLFVANETNTWFLQGVNPNQMTISNKAGIGAVPGTLCRVPKVHFGAGKMVDDLAVWLSTDGIVYGTTGGLFGNLTATKYQYDPVFSGASVFVSNEPHRVVIATKG